MTTATLPDRSIHRTHVETFCLALENRYLSVDAVARTTHSESVDSPRQSAIGENSSSAAV